MASRATSSLAALVPSRRPQMEPEPSKMIVAVGWPCASAVSLGRQKPATRVANATLGKLIFVITGLVARADRSV